MKIPEIISFPRHLDSNGELCVYESAKQVPFVILRVFTVTAKVGDFRGDHAHKECLQLLICVSGKIMVTCDNGFGVVSHMLEEMGNGLLVPASIWTKQEYQTDGAVLMVLCDRGYEEEDYIRDYEEFKKFVAL
jgi:hypothetical protein